MRRHRTAAALGFDGPTRNSLDSVSDRDFALDYLMAAGYLCGGWQMLRALTATASQGDAFSVDKAATARFYLTRLLPSASSLSLTTNCLHEYYGMIAYWLQGWL